MKTATQEPENETAVEAPVPQERNDFVMMDLGNGKMKELGPDEAMAIITARRETANALRLLEARGTTCGAEGANKAAPGARRTSLVAGRGEYDFNIDVDGVTLSCREMPAALERWVEDTYPQTLAQALGCDAETTQSQEDLERHVQFIVTPDPDKAEERILTERTQADMRRLKDVLRAKQVELFDRVIQECVVGWSADDPIADKMLMPRTIKKQVCNRIVAASQFGADKSDLS